LSETLGGGRKREKHEGVLEKVQKKTKSIGVRNEKRGLLPRLGFIMGRTLKRKRGGKVGDLVVEEVNNFWGLLRGSGGGDE